MAHDSRRGVATSRLFVALIPPATVQAELAGIAAPEKLDGTSIVGLLKDPQAPRDRPAHSVVRRGQIWGRAVYTEDFRYTEWGDNGSKGVELYDLKSDPHEFVNLTDDKSRSAEAARLKKLLARIDSLNDSDPTGSTGD